MPILKSGWLDATHYLNTSVRVEVFPALEVPCGFVADLVILRAAISKR